MSQSSPTRRRWFQFGLGTLFCALTIFALWLGWELKFIRERRAWIRRYPLLVDPETFRLLPPRTAHIPWWRTLLHDDTIPLIAELGIWDENDRSYATGLFPEAKLVNLVNAMPMGTFGPAGGAPNFQVTQPTNSTGETVVPTSPSVPLKYIQQSRVIVARPIHLMSQAYCCLD